MSSGPRPARSEDRTRILQAIARARSWRDQLASGTIVDIATIARSETMAERAVRTTLMLAFLSPQIVDAIVAGRLPRGLGLARLAALPPAWAEQHQALGL